MQSRSQLHAPAGILVTIFLSLCAWVSSAHADTYLTLISDIPLPEGFVEEEENGFVFDAPEGRVITAYALGKKSHKGLISYYKQSLLALGWENTPSKTSSKVLTFEREGEMLAIEIRMEGAVTQTRNTTLIFHLMPSP